MADRYESLDRLKRLLDEGAITEEEFLAEKARLLNEAPDETPTSHRPWGLEENTFCMLLHLSQFASFVVPSAGLILPIVMWAMEKGNSRQVDNHGRIVLNWMISSFIYFIISFILVFVVIGIPMIVALIIADIIFVIMGAVKANEGQYWSYPMSIRFLSVEDTPTEFGSRY